MEVRNTVTKQVEELEDILCDLCGNTCLKHTFEDGQREFEAGQLTFLGGYWSEHDGLRVQLDLCENCVLDIYKRRKRAEGEPEIPEEAYQW